MHTPRNIQSPYVANDFWTQWGSVNPRMALFIKVTPKAFWSGISPIGFTSNTRDMTLPAHTYSGSPITFKSAVGITPSVVEQILDDPTNLEMSGIYQAGTFTQADVLAGKWDYAEIEVFSACWDNVNLGELVHFKGNLGDFKDYAYYFKAEGRGLIARLSSDTCDVTSRNCRVKEFRDAQCGHTASTVTIAGTSFNVTQTGRTGNPSTSGIYDNEKNAIVFDVSTFTGNVPTYGQLTAWAEYFDNGKITSNSGANLGNSREILAVKEATGGYPYIIVTLKRSMPFVIEGGSKWHLTMGCRRTVEDCRKYDNIINFRGEPYIPTIEEINRIPEAT